MADINQTMLRVVKLPSSELVCITPAGTAAIFHKRKRQVHLLNTKGASGNGRPLDSLESATATVAPLPKSPFMGVGCADGSISVWNLDQTKKVATCAEGAASGVFPMGGSAIAHIVASRSYLAAASSRQLDVYHLTSGAALASMQHLSQSVSAMAWVGDDALLVACKDHILSWRITAGGSVAPGPTLVLDVLGALDHLVVSPSLGFVAARTQDLVHVWCLSSEPVHGKLLPMCTLEGPDDSAPSWLGWHSNGVHLIAAFDHELYAWDVRDPAASTPRHAITLTGFEDGSNITSAAMQHSPGSLLAAVSDMGQVLVFDCASFGPPTSGPIPSPAAASGAVVGPCVEHRASPPPPATPCRSPVQVAWHDNTLVVAVEGEELSCSLEAGLTPVSTPMAAGGAAADQLAVAQVHSSRAGGMALLGSSGGRREGPSSRGTQGSVGDSFNGGAVGSGPGSEAGAGMKPIPSLGEVVDLGIWSGGAAPGPVGGRLTLLPPQPPQPQQPLMQPPPPLDGATQLGAYQAEDSGARWSALARPVVQEGAAWGRPGSGGRGTPAAVAAQAAAALLGPPQGVAYSGTGGAGLAVGSGRPQLHAVKAANMFTQAIPAGIRPTTWPQPPVYPLPTNPIGLYQGPLSYQPHDTTPEQVGTGVGVPLSLPGDGTLASLGLQGAGGSRPGSSGPHASGAAPAHAHTHAQAPLVAQLQAQMQGWGGLGAGIPGGMLDGARPGSGPAAGSQGAGIGGYGGLMQRLWGGVASTGRAPPPSDAAALAAVLAAQDAAALAQPLYPKGYTPPGTKTTPPGTKPAKKTPEEEVRNVFVGNLAQTVGDSALEAVFGQFGTITHVQIVRDKESKKSKGYAFIQYASPLSAAMAMRHMNGMQLEGPFQSRQIRVLPSFRPAAPAASSAGALAPGAGGNGQEQGGGYGGGYDVGM